MASEQKQRAAVVREARTWIGTPYHHCADVKGAGVDCAMILVRVYSDVGLIEPFDPRPYPPDWHLHREDERYLGLLLARSHQVATPREGDVFLLRYGRAYSHGGIVTAAPNGAGPGLTVVHAFMSHRIVVEEEIGRCAGLARRLEGAIFASFWGGE